MRDENYVRPSGRFADHHLRDDRIKESDIVRPGVIADFGYDGGVVRFEIMQASKIVQNAKEIQAAVAE